MIRTMCFSALLLFAAALSPGNAGAQQLSIGLGGVQYNGYGRGYYGGYGQGYYGPGGRVYSPYGYGPYGYGSRPVYSFPSNGAGSAYQFPGNGQYNNGYYTTGQYNQYYNPVYSPYGFSINTY